MSPTHFSTRYGSIDLSSLFSSHFLPSLLRRFAVKFTATRLCAWTQPPPLTLHVSSTHAVKQATTRLLAHDCYSRSNLLAPKRCFGLFSTPILFGAVNTYPQDNLTPEHPREQVTVRSAMSTGPEVLRPHCDHSVTSKVRICGPRYRRLWSALTKEEIW